MLLKLFLLAPAVFAIPAPTHSIPYNAVAPRQTPAVVRPHAPNLIPLAHFAPLFGFRPRAANKTFHARDVAEHLVRGVPINAADNALTERGSRSTLTRRAVLNSTETAQAQSAVAATCVDSSGNDTYISSLFYYGGAGFSVYLCQNAVIEITNAIFLYYPNQTLATEGFPTGTERALLRVTAQNQSCAIFGAINYADYVAVRNIQIDGARETLGILSGGLALLEMGGYNVGQTVDNVHAYEPRGWSVLHAIEGTNTYCSGMSLTNNQIGPSGHAPSGAQQFKRDSTGTYTPGQCGIVIFGAPGSKITGNTVQSLDRQLLGGINMVDWGPFSGSFIGTEVTGNTIIAETNFIKLGIAMGGLTWGTDNRTIARTYGGLVQSNTFQSGSTGYFGYAIGMAGHENATVSGNSAVNANFGSIESASCFTAWFPLPAPQSFIADQWTTPGAVLQSGFTLSTLVLLICRGPGAITATGGVAR